MAGKVLENTHGTFSFKQWQQLAITGNLWNKIEYYPQARWTSNMANSVGDENRWLNNVPSYLTVSLNT